MKKLTGFVAAGLLCAGSAHAGFIQPAPVDVDPANMIASGDMVTARFAADPDVFIGCGTRTIGDGAGGAFRFAFCQAEDADGDRAFCNVFEDGTALADALFDRIQNFADFSFVTFSWEEQVNPDGSTTNICNRIGHSTQSFYIPDFKKPREL